MGKNLKSTIQQAWKENPQFFVFAVLWGIAILEMGALTSRFYERYLLPVAPVLAVGMAWISVRGGVFERLRSIKIATLIFLVVVVVLIGFSIWINSGEN